MDELITLVNRLQDVFSTLNQPCPIDLPQIAVVGGQSAGKSSVLENFVGRDFLPRGSGIVTRRPLVLQLVHSPQSDKGEWAEFAHQRGKIFKDFDLVRKEIEDETDRETGQNKGISSRPINLKIYSPHVLNLTLVDLPGITKVPVGDQPKDIELLIREMIMEFISRPNCLILAVSPANSDLANSDALKLAKEVDPQGVRTIGVLTKLDLMDQGTDARMILENKFLPLRRGYVGIVNRSQKDIDGRKDIKAAMTAERNFFMNHPSYRHMAGHHGTMQLQKTLNQQLTNHIRDSLPDLRAQLLKQCETLEKEAEKYKKTMGIESRGGATRFLMSAVNNFVEKVWGAIEGGTSPSMAEMQSDELLCGARINRIFFERFPYEMVIRSYDEKQLRRKIAITIKNIHGIRGGMFTPDQAFDTICREIISELRQPAQNCVLLTAAEVTEVIYKFSSELANFPALQSEVELACTQHLRQSQDRTAEQIDILFDIELAYMNTNHPEFIGFANAENAAGQMVKKATVEDRMLRKGYLTSPGTFGGKEFWFVLAGSTLSWYKDDTEKELRHQIKLENIKLRDLKSRGPKTSFEIYSEDSKYLYKDTKSLVLQSNTRDEAEGWKASFLRAGVYPDRVDKVEPESTAGFIDPVLERQVGTILTLVDSYINIVSTSIRDMVPKIIMRFLIGHIRENMNQELVSELLSLGPPENLVQEGEMEREQRESTMTLLKMTREAIQAISNINTSTRYEPTPAPLSQEQSESWSSHNYHAGSSTTSNGGAGLGADAGRPSYVNRVPNAGLNPPKSPAPGSKPMTPTSGRAPPPPFSRPSAQLPPVGASAGSGSGSGTVHQAPQFRLPTRPPQSAMSSTAPPAPPQRPPRS